MWDNLGRVVGEYPHLSSKLMRSRITVEGLEYLERVKRSQTGAMFISGHFANWEIVPLTAAIYGLKLVLIYREPNNPVAAWLLRRMRNSFSQGYYRKGREGAQESIRALKAGESVAMLVDQKLSDGRPVSFFGHSAMTATAPVQMAIKFQVPLFMAHIVRTDGAHFHLTLLPPIHFEPKSSPEEAMELLHRRFEQWIREHPGQWFWVHNRWNWKSRAE
jgi:KDO2-lipid IV(A) lauroyltransferase